MAKPGSETFQLVLDFRAEKANGRIFKRFQDEFYALDLLRILYDDNVKTAAKSELLIALEEYGHLGITEESVDQIITSLLDIFHQAVDKADTSQFVCQLLTTCTSLLIQLDQLEADICGSVVKELVAIVTGRLNQPGSERLRACACRSLIHLEEFSQGLLLPYYDDIIQLYRRERTYMFQDYALLAANAMASYASQSTDKLRSGSSTDTGRGYKHQMSYEPHDLREVAADLVENIALFTRSGAFRCIQSISVVVNRDMGVSPMIFKPLLLHQTSTMSCIVFHTVLYLQRQFGVELLTAQEEADMLHRLCKMTTHPCLNQLHRLLAAHWLHMYQQDAEGNPVIHRSVVDNHRLMFYPSVFDSEDVQLVKLYLTSLCADTTNDEQGFETSILLGSVGCLHKMVWHTGSSQAARALFRALYFIYSRHNNQSFSQDIQRFVRGLISEFPHFIPHSIDFVDSIHILNINSNIYVETLSLLHQQVVISTPEQIHSSFHYYLVIMRKVAAQTTIDQQSTLKFLLYLVENAADIDDCSWRLGHGILDVCRIIIICQGTENYFSELSGLLFSMIGSYNNTDVQDKARLYYCLITNATDKKVRNILQLTLSDVESMNQALASLLPGANEKKSLTGITNLEETIFTWERLSVEVCCWQGNDKNGGTQSDQDGAILPSYLQYMENIEVAVNLKFSLQLASSCVFERVHAVCVSLENTRSPDTIARVQVPCLVKDEPQEMVVKLKPKSPVPQSFLCSADFCDECKQTYCTRLTSSDLTFSHLMIPLPWKPDQSQQTDTFFSELWDWVLRLSDTEERCGIESVKLFDVGPQDFQRIHSTKLYRFLCSTSQAYSNSCYAIFLPPGYHVLLRCKGQGCQVQGQGQKNTLIVTMAMDLQALLPHVDTYLTQLFTE